MNEKVMNEKIRQLTLIGQSLWYDNIRKSVLESGELKSLIDEGVIRGLTSNPSIFEKAIGGSTDYDLVLAALARQGKSTEEIYLELAVADIRAAADLLRGVYESSSGVDGYVSIEVAPHLAHDAEGTVRDAFKLRARVDRPNLMIKVPGTEAGVSAVRELTAAGVSVNVTLLFSLSQYQKVAEAYLSGLEARIADGLSVKGISSVASFFVSRVDTLVDMTLASRAPAQEEELRGKAAIANAQLAYALWQGMMASERWKRIASSGGLSQRVLFASTSTKDKRYPDTLYVDELIGPETVNTLPPETVVAFLDHGAVRSALLEGTSKATAHVAALSQLGLDLEKVGDELQVAGVKAFQKSMDSLMSTIEARRNAFLKSS